MVLTKRNIQQEIHCEVSKTAASNYHTNLSILQYYKREKKEKEKKES
jgi:hypothetical protein